MTGVIDAVGLTGVGVAMMRARETQRPDALFHDEYAQAFADAAVRELASDEATWTRMLDLVDRFHDGRVVAVRWFDDYVSAAVADGVTQFVSLGSGLDTRALRLATASVRYFELDRPAVIDFKEAVLTGSPAECDRRLVPCDLAGDWFTALVAAGYDPAVPTAWYEEGVLAYLSPEAAIAVVDTVIDVAVPGTSVAKAAIAPPDNETYARLRAFVGRGDTDAPSAGVSGTDRDLAYRFADRGWRLRIEAHADVASRLGRGDGTTGPSAGDYVVATKL